MMRQYYEIHSQIPLQIQHNTFKLREPPIMIHYPQVHDVLKLNLAKTQIKVLIFILKEASLLKKVIAQKQIQREVSKNVTF